MRSFMNRLLSGQGDIFNDKVSDFFDGVGGLNIKSRVTKIGNLRELQDHLAISTFLWATRDAREFL